MRLIPLPELPGIANAIAEFHANRRTVLRSRGGELKSLNRMANVLYSKQTQSNTAKN
jgi:hypothetical protein